MNKYHFLIGDIRVELQSDFPLPIQKNMLPFRLRGESDAFKPDVLYSISYMPISGQIPYELNNMVFKQDYSRVYCSGKSFIIKDGLTDREDYTVIDTENRRHVRIFVSRPTNQYYDISAPMYFPSIFPAFNGFLLHASFINVDGGAVLFSAPSGTGKSTQAALWQRFRGSDIINGDKALLRRTEQDGRWYAFGSPWAGSSAIHRSEKLPLRAVVLLRQAPQNSIEAVEPFTAFKQLFSQSSAPLFDPELLAKSTELLEHLANNVPILLLKCRPDEEAVKILENALFYL